MNACMTELKSLKHKVIKQHDNMDMDKEVYSVIPAIPPAGLRLIIDNREIRKQIGLSD